MALSWVIAACAKPTGVVAEVSASTAVSTFSLSVANVGGVLATQSFDGKTLPGTVFVELSPSAGHVRLVARSSTPALSASGSADVVEGDQPTVKLAMKAGEGDTDGDGWPDSIDDCPTVSDPEQTCGSADAGAGVPCGQRTDLLTCWDFEDGGTPLNSFGNATAEVVTGGAALGQRYLKITRATGSNTYSGQNIDIDGPQAHVFLRLFVKLGAVHPKSFTLLSPQQTQTDTGLEMNLNTDGGVITGFTLNNRGLGMSGDFSAPMSLDAWHCIEAELIPGNSTDAHYGLWVDEQAVASASSLGSFAFDRIFIGATYDVGDGNDVLLDEVASANQRIYCR